MRVLSAEAMAEVDRRAIEELGIPGMVLMENAAIGVVDALAERFPEARRVVILCGPGNNGGDGLAVARHLAVRGYDLRIFLVRGQKQPTGNAATQWDICRRMGLAVEEVLSEEDISAVLPAAGRADLIVDALFGTGLSRPLEGHIASLVEALEGLEAPVVAVDVPSGLDGSRADFPGLYLQADLTVAFAAAKIPHVLPPAESAVGELVVADLGIPPSLIAGAPGDLSLAVPEELASFLMARDVESHKGSFGHLLLIAGSQGKSGAAVLAARAAVRGGAGLVTVAVPASILDLVDGGSLESMTLRLPQGPQGRLSSEGEEEIVAAAEGKAAVALGPGLGSGADTSALVRRLANKLALPMVLDADGLNAFAGRAAELRERPAPTVLTPHPGELGRLLGASTVEIAEDRLGAVRRAAEVTGCIVVLKGYRSLVAEPEGGVSINPTGNPGMASGGSGDVLTGLLGALLAQGYEALAAAQLGVYLHGLAGDLAVEEVDETALCASDLIAFLGPALGALRAG